MMPAGPTGPPPSARSCQQILHHADLCCRPIVLSQPTKIYFCLVQLLGSQSVKLPSLAAPPCGLHRTFLETILQGSLGQMLAQIWRAWTRMARRSLSPGRPLLRACSPSSMRSPTSGRWGLDHARQEKYHARAAVQMTEEGCICPCPCFLDLVLYRLVASQRIWGSWHNCFCAGAQEIFRFLRNPRKPAILAMSRPDAKKNITTLVKAFGENPTLRELANLVLIMVRSLGPSQPCIHVMTGLAALLAHAACHHLHA